jgi:hypothetical protein
LRRVAPLTAFRHESSGSKAIEHRKVEVGAPLVGLTRAVQSPNKTLVSRAAGRCLARFGVDSGGKYPAHGSHPIPSHGFLTCILQRDHTKAPLADVIAAALSSSHSKKPTPGYRSCIRVRSRLGTVKTMIQLPSHSDDELVTANGCRHCGRISSLYRSSRWFQMLDWYDLVGSTGAEVQHLGLYQSFKYRPVVSNSLTLANLAHYHPHYHRRYHPNNQPEWDHSHHG